MDVLYSLVPATGAPQFKQEIFAFSRRLVYHLLSEEARMAYPIGNLARCVKTAMCFQNQASGYSDLETPYVPLFQSKACYYIILSINTSDDIEFRARKG